MKKRALVASLAVVGLTLTSSYQGADAAIDNKKTGIQIFDKVKCDNEMNVKGSTKGTGNYVDSTKVFYRLTRDGDFIDNFSNSKNSDYVTITMTHSGNDDSKDNDGPLWKVQSTHRVDYSNSSPDFSEDSDKAYGKCGGSSKSSPKSQAAISKIEDVEAKLERKWKEVMEAHNIDESKWSRYTFEDFKGVQTNIDNADKFTPVQKAVSLAHAEMENVKLEKGDSEGLYLLDKAEEKGLYIYQKANGENVVVEFTLKGNNDIKGLSASNDSNTIWKLVDTKVKQ
ncbi:hypothetical protein [Brevibacillus laterosporus]|uniref:hypothetical protein n=1 Tax=Brevibacillus laterosporus TaxID=1465 RepID=UPI00264D4F39|nr:hypothetical protein [Brevibacillus laterosporus]MDN9011555.1 hypothetical protein [Brevibacillus laterosporus]MDO0942812.1 hypothetical protein [Brevibacillus laterosporus]